MSLEKIDKILWSGQPNTIKWNSIVYLYNNKKIDRPIQGLVILYKFFIFIFIFY